MIKTGNPNLFIFIEKIQLVLFKRHVRMGLSTAPIKDGSIGFDLFEFCISSPIEENNEFMTHYYII